MTNLGRSMTLLFLVAATALAAPSLEDEYDEWFGPMETDGAVARVLREEYVNVTAGNTTTATKTLEATTNGTESEVLAQPDTTAAPVTPATQTCAALTKKFTCGKRDGCMWVKGKCGQKEESKSDTTAAPVTPAAQTCAALTKKFTCGKRDGCMWVKGKCGQKEESEVLAQPEGTAAPVSTPPPAASADCVDSTTWQHAEKKDWRCKYVAKGNTATRCKYEGADGTTASESCPKTCGTCPAAPVTEEPTASATCAAITKRSACGKAGGCSFFKKKCSACSEFKKSPCTKEADGCAWDTMKKACEQDAPVTEEPTTLTACAAFSKKRLCGKSDGCMWANGKCGQKEGTKAALSDNITVQSKRAQVALVLLGLVGVGVALATVGKKTSAVGQPGETDPLLGGPTAEESVAQFIPFQENGAPANTLRL